MSVCTRECTQCQKLRPIAEYKSSGNEHRYRRCNQCRATRLAGIKHHLKCIRCCQMLPRADFACGPDGARQSLYCHPCEVIAKQTVARQIRKSPLLSDAPCPNCQRYFYLSNHHRRTSRVRYCSVECVLEMRAQQPKRCVQCNLDKPMHAFERYATLRQKTPARRPRCRECYDHARETTLLKRQLWAQPKQTRRSMQMHGKHHGKPHVEMSLAQWVIEQKCWLCADHPRTARLKDTKKPWSKQNTYPLCSTCSRLLQVGGIHLLLVQANRIAAARPLSPPVRPPGGGA